MNWKRVLEQGLTLRAGSRIRISLTYPINCICHGYYKLHDGEVQTVDRLSDTNHIVTVEAQREHAGGPLIHVSQFTVTE